MKIYQADRNDDGAQVVTKIDDGQFGPLNPRYDLANHSPDGFEWGYLGSGPAQLALALVADATGDDVVAVHVYQELKRELLAELPAGGWRMNDRDIVGWVESYLHAYPEVRERIALEKTYRAEIEDLERQAQAAEKRS